jgi:hypothetical protein
MVARGWGVAPFISLPSRATPIPAGDHEGRPYGSSGLLPVFMAQVDALSWAR